MELNTTIKTNVIIVGGGVSGLVLSILLKEKNIDHVILDRVGKRKGIELSETIPPSALVLIESLNLLALFEKSASKTFGYQSVWNSGNLTTSNFFDHNPYKYGLKLNKSQLLCNLSNLVEENIQPFTQLLGVSNSSHGVEVKLETESGNRKIQGSLIVDATGRNRAVLNHLNVDSENFGDQVAMSCHLPRFNHPQLIHPVFVESFDHGWGIVSSINQEINSISLFTEKGSPIINSLKNYTNWQGILSNTKFLKEFLSDSPSTKIVGGKANSSKAKQIVGLNWLAIGDAAIAFDPLSSHGVTNAIYCANSAASAIEERVATNTQTSFVNYENTLNQIFDGFLHQKMELYEDSYSS